MITVMFLEFTCYCQRLVRHLVTVITIKIICLCLVEYRGIEKVAV